MEPNRSLSGFVTLLVASLAAVPAPAQEPAQDPTAGTVEVEAVRQLPPIRYRLDEAGVLGIRVGDEDQPFVNHDLLGAGTSVGFFGIIALACSGDLVSLCDAVDFFERQGLQETELLRAIAREPKADDPAYLAHVRLLAVRAAQARKMKPALGLLHRLAERPAADPFLREAVEEAIATLRDEPSPPRERELLAVEDALGVVPADAEFVLRVDSARMPAMTGLLTLGRLAAEQSTARYLAMDDASEGLSPWIVSGLASAAATGAMGYTLSSWVGNLRLHRTIVALRFEEDFETEPDCFLHAWGTWSLDTIAARLRTQGADFEERDGALELDLGAGYLLRVDARELSITREGFASPRGAAGAAELAKLIGGEPQLALWWAPDAAYPEEIAKFRIQVASLTVPRTMDGHLRLATTWASPGMATAISGLAGGLGRLLETALDDHDGMAPLVEAAAEMKVLREGARVDFDAPLPRTELMALLRECVRYLAEGF
ncbi:MAG: hypothetical protein IT457_01775 [Planctomycetes bacterium]|nr:hypothetical protein [Planctomycetota bacterium]